MKKLLVSLSLSLGLFAQQTTLLQVSPPPPVQNISVSVIGNSGGLVKYCYFVIARYTIGNANVSPPTCVFNAPSAISVSNYIQIVWQGTPGATGYDVVRLTGEQFPSSGTCSNCLVASNTTTTSVSNNAAVVTPYTLGTPISGVTGTYSLNNRDYATPRSFISPALDPSSVIGGGGGGTPGGSNTDIQYNNSGAFGGYPIPLAVNKGGTGTATPALIAGTNVTITGTWPNNTINSSGGGATYTTGPLLSMTVDNGAHTVDVDPVVVPLLSAANTWTGYNNLLNGQMALPTSTVAGLPAAALNTNKVFVVTDSNSATSCATGGSTNVVLCRSNGATYAPLGDGSGGGGASTKHVVFQGGGFNLGNPYSGGLSETVTAGMLTEGYATRYIGTSQFADGGAKGQITWVYPSTWNGSAVTIKLILGPADAGAGDVTFTPYSTCIPDGADMRNLTYVSGTPGTVAAGGVQLGRINLTLTIPVGTCVAGSPVIIGLDRSAADSYTGTVTLVLAEITGTW